MKKKFIMIAILGVLFQESFLYADAKAGFQNFADKMKSAGESAWDMLKGMGGMFGAVPSGYQCNWELINDSDQEVSIYYRNFLSIMGGFFPSKDDISGGSLHAIQPYTATFTYNIVPAGSALGGFTASLPASSPSPTSGLYNGIHPYFALFMGCSPAKTSTKDSPVKGTNFYQEWQLELGRQYDNSINYYHAYTGKRFVGGNATHMTMVEMAGLYDPDVKGDDSKDNIAFSSNLGQIDPNATSSTPQAGSVYFYNTTSQPVQLAVTLNDGTKYLDIALEPLSYNLLSCLPSQTINGSILTFGGASPFKTLHVPAMTVQGNTYIFEIYQDAGQSSPNVGIQGFNPGNHDICVSNTMRDISPQQATLWIQSVAQKNSVVKSGQTPKPNPDDYDLQGQVWIVYQSPSTNLMQKVTLGNPTTLNFIRPTLADQIGYIYFLYVNTEVDFQATAFINNFLKGTVGSAIKQKAIATINTPIDLAKVEKFTSNEKITGSVTNQLKAFSSGNVKSSSGVQESPMALSNTLAQEVLSGRLPSDIARLQDASTGLTGYLLGIDVFTSFGGQAAPVSYYQMIPSTLFISILSGVLEQSLDAKKIKSLASSTTANSQKTDTSKTDTSAIDTQVSKALDAQVLTWFNEYIAKGSQVVEPEVVSFLLKYGSDNLFDKKGALTKGALNRAKSFVNGLVSLANPPILYSMVSAQNPAYIAPTGMPGAPELPATNKS